MAGQEKDVMQEQAPDFLNMSDEDLMKFDPSSMVAAEPDVEGEVADVASDVQDDVEDAEDQADTGAATESDEEQDTEAKAGSVETGAEDSDKGTGAPAKADSDKQPQSKDTAAAVIDPAKEEGAAADAGTVDYKAAYEQLLTPFKANGRDIQVKNVDDAIALMQMGANYNKKMAGLKPNLKLMKMLESNGLLDEAKLSYLIDLDKKDPEAINKLVKDSGMDPLDLSAERAGEYKPKTYTVDEREMELDAVLSELEGTPTYNRTLEVVSTKWDGASKGVIASKPEILKVINAHMESGIYDLIASAVENERTFGRLNGLTDLEAYRQVGDSIQARGGFSHLGHQGKTPTQPVIVQPKPKQDVNDDKLRDKKRAASSTKTAVPNAMTKADFNPLGMSDEEFSKQGNPKFL